MAANGAGTRWRRFAGGLALLAGLALSGCQSIDNAMFGPQETPPPPLTPPDAQTPPPSPILGGHPAQQPAASAGQAVPIAAGTDTGTQVGRSVQGLRNELSGISDRAAAENRRLGDLRASNLSGATGFLQAKAQIVARLQLGTTRGNPELTTQFGVARSSLDALDANIRAMNALNGDVNADVAAAHRVSDQISATLQAPGATDEDSRQLRALGDAAVQLIAYLDRLQGDLGADTQRLSAFAANSRAELPGLNTAIANGDMSGVAAAPVAVATAPAAAAGAPIVTIPFSHRGTAYEKPLYTALDGALKTQPHASFSIVAVTLMHSSARELARAQAIARREAQEIAGSMMAMGVPASRIAVSSSTDPSISAGEVRVYTR